MKENVEMRESRVVWIKRKKRLKKKRKETVKTDERWWTKSFKTIKGQVWQKEPCIFTEGKEISVIEEYTESLSEED